MACSPVRAVRKRCLLCVVCPYALGSLFTLVIAELESVVSQDCARHRSPSPLNEGVLRDVGGALEFLFFVCDLGIDGWDDYRFLIGDRILGGIIKT